MKPHILIIDDDLDFINDFSLVLEENYKCTFSLNGYDAIKSIQESVPDLILLDLMLGEEENGLELLNKIQRIEEVPIIMVTDYASVQTAVEALKLGASDYISKTTNLTELKILIEKTINQRILKNHAQSLEEQLNKDYRTIIGESEGIRDVYYKIKLYANTDSTILITGESGVGKELVATKVHFYSTRKVFPFVAINCAAIPKDLLESELFGHEKGSFTGADKRKIGKFEIASSGTIFLDEISELDPNAQVKLLRVIQEKEFERVGGNTTIKSNVRIVAATNKNLFHLVKENKFREDLYYRLDVLPINVPPLRERKEDINILVNHFIHKACEEMKIPLKTISENALEILENYDWPGNIRELQNFITRAVILSQGNKITIGDLDMNLTTSNKKLLNVDIEKIPTTWEEMDSLRKEVADQASRKVERLYLQNLLDKFEGNITKAAEFAGINRSNLHKMIRKCGF